MLVSQRTSGFDPAIGLTRTISILFRTKCGKDLEVIARTVGNRVSRVIPKLMRTLETVYFPLKPAAPLQQVRIEDFSLHNTLGRVKANAKGIFDKYLRSNDIRRVTLGGDGSDANWNSGFG